MPFPAIVLAAALLGFCAWRRSGEQVSAAGELRVATSTRYAPPPSGLAVWILPLRVIAVALGRDHMLAQLGWFFSKLAVVTFGGAYAVLAYMAQQVVENYGWLTAGEMLDALGLAETTPGPLILVTEFVGTLAAYRAGTGAPAVLAVAGAMVTLWATFAPCFLWIFAGAPYVERLNNEPRLKAALAAVTAAVVGVILNLTVWFALHVLFVEGRGAHDRSAAGLRSRSRLGGPGCHRSRRARGGLLLACTSALSSRPRPWRPRARLARDGRSRLSRAIAL